MAKQNQPKSKGKGNETSKLYWVRCDIADDDMPVIDEWINSNVADMLGYVCNIAENGVAVSLKPTDDGGYMCAAYGTLVQGNDRGSFGVSAFAATAGDALACLLYKYIVLLDNGRAIELPTEGHTRRMR